MKVALLLVFVLVVAVQCQDAAFFDAFPDADPEAFYDFLNSKEAFEEHEVPKSPALRSVEACANIPAPADTDDVKNLKPGNVKVVLGMGDSITAAMSAKDTLIISLKEYRGLSYCIGADTGITTFPNILKQFSPNLIGFSTGIGGRTISTNGLNGGVSGAVNKDMLGQAQWLVTQMKANSKINYQNDWKVLTVWIGSNNLCAVCNNDAANNGANFETEMRSALEYLRVNVPRLFVNLIGNLDISTLYNVNSGACGTLHSIECACVGSSDATKRAKVSTTAKDYVTRANTIAKYYQGLNLKNFTVVVQPFLINNIISDRSLLSAADCFHPSAAGHVLASVALWNNMLTPAAQKKTSWSSTDTPICPTASSIFPTY